MTGRYPVLAALLRATVALASLYLAARRFQRAERVRAAAVARLGAS